MMTWLPYPNFAVTAMFLERRHLDRQRAEALQVLQAIRNGGGFSRHPLVGLWRGHEDALRLYHDVMCREWARRGWAQEFSPLLQVKMKKVVVPEWVGDLTMGASHRQTLLALLPAHYRAQGWTDPAQQGLYWPDPLSPGVQTR